MRIIVLGYLVRGPLGGMAWHHLQYVLGLAGLGHDVYFMEEGGDGSCYDPRVNAMVSDASYGLRFAQDALARLELGERWAYYDAHTGCWLGPAGVRGAELCRSADLLINVSASNPLREWHLKIPVRAFIDTDPAFTQVRNLTDAVARENARLHTHFFSFGENIGRGAAIPDDGFHWLPTRQPIVLTAWPVRTGPAVGRYTTVMQWDSYAALEYGGATYGMKSHSFAPYSGLPLRTPVSLELAVGAAADTRRHLEQNGWTISNPLEVAADPWRYQDYIAASRGEFTVAKDGYVRSRSGWFSERSAAYLASGRPVVTQDTAFGDWLPHGEGVIAFDTPETALEALDAVEGRYAAHCEAARALAEEYFDARQVLRSLLDRATETPSVAAGVR